MSANNPYVDMKLFEAGEGFPTVFYSGFFTQADETIIYAAPAATFSDKEKVTGYTGRSNGISVRVAKGVSVKSGQSAGKAIREDVRKYNYGDLIITNKRIVFTGKDDSFEYLAEKLTAVKMLDNNSFVIQSGKTSKNVYAEGMNARYAFGFIDCIAKAATGSDLQTEMKRFQSSGIVKAQIDNGTAPSQITKKQNKVSAAKGCLIIVLMILLVFIVLLLIFGLFLSKNTDTNNTSTTVTAVQDNTAPTYTGNELLSLNDHPTLLGSYEEAKQFYSDYNDERIILYDKGSERTLAERKYEKDGKWPLLEIVRDATHDKYNGSITINYDLKTNPDLEPIDLQQCLDYLFEYLPSDYMDYYKIDNAYTYNLDGNHEVYVASFRLNEDGIAKHNADVNDYPFYSGFVINHQLDIDRWTIDIGSDDGNTLDWANKYAKPWDISFN